MDTIEERIERLYLKDNKSIARAESMKSKGVYKFFDKFVEMISNGNSYIRTRGLCLIA